MADTETTESLLDEICGLTKLEREDNESAEDFKARIVRHFADTYPNTDEGNAAFDALPANVTDWVDSATEVLRKNRGARKKSRLPELEGLEEDAAESARVGRGAKKEPKEKKERVKKERAPGAGRAQTPLAATFAPAEECANVSKFIDKPLRAAGFKKQKERSDDGYIVFSKEGKADIHIGTGKTETAYLMGWRPVGVKEHQYGGETLQAYLDGLA